LIPVREVKTMIIALVGVLPTQTPIVFDGKVMPIQVVEVETPRQWIRGGEEPESAGRGGEVGADVEAGGEAGE
jgi:hypothetical protein